MTAQLEPGRIDFYDDVTPGLRDDRYRVRVTTTVEHADAPDASDAQVLEVFTEDRWIEVAGPRYRLDRGEVLAAFPPPDAEGDYDTTLPHVVLRRRTLPWERVVPPGTTTPWLAVLVLGESEAVLKREAVAPDGRPCTTVTLTEAVARRALPRRADVRLLCHARHVAPGGADVAADDDGWVAVVTANRLPAHGEPQRACLVSLADHGAVLDAVGSGGPVPASVALPVLYDWTFRVGEGGTFQEVALNLAQRAALLGVTAANPVRLAHTRRDGTPGTALYRGPIVGRATDPKQPADDETDVSLAAAATLGRLLAAADRPLVRELSEWRRRDLMSALGPPAFSPLARAARTSPADVAEETAARLSAATADPWRVPEALREPDEPPARRVRRAAAEDFAAEPPPVRPGPAALAAAAPSEPPPAVADAVERYRLLYGIPLDHLIPDPDLLPQESARFFVLDDAWLDALAEGVLGVGGTGSRERALTARHAAALKSLRRTAAFPGPVSGMLLRSSLIARWPTLRVRAFGTPPPAPDAAQPRGALVPLRSETLTPTLLLVLWPGTPAAVWIEEPERELGQGFDRSGGQLVVPPVPASGGGPVPVPTRDGRAVDVAQLANLLAVQPGRTPAAAPGPLGAALLRRPYRQVFQ
ncbi:hypothetical protein [Actinomadura atramentaria]|uniref:hypothetical protein n=1 Tax=Actinomadura atramentaria TaxID=1990 RepID=UPI0003782DAF|nr:hypothetical protein [Actinomadura atramentaria]